MRNWILNWTSFSRNLLAALVEFYRVHLKWFVVGDCKYHPTCSEYAHEVIQHEKPSRAVMLISKRLLRCHPWSAGGFDPHVH